MGKGLFRDRKKGPPPEALELEKGLLATRALIAQAYAGFNSASDGDLVESYIYEIQALQARYSYLLRRRKALEGEKAPEALGGKVSAPRRVAAGGAAEPGRAALPSHRAGRAAEVPSMEPLSPKALGEAGSAVLPVA